MASAEPGTDGKPTQGSEVTAVQQPWLFSLGVILCNPLSPPLYF